MVAMAVRERSWSVRRRRRRRRRVHRLATKLREEFVALLPPTIFFLVALHLVALIRTLMLKGTGIAVTTPLQVTLAALILGKAVLVADMLPYINRYPDKSLAYNVAWKTTICVLVAMLVHYLERLVDFWREAGGPGRGPPEVAGGDHLATLLGDPDPPGRADSRATQTSLAMQETVRLLTAEGGVWPRPFPSFTIRGYPPVGPDFPPSPFESV
jgi:hypothetical protein